jgi:methyl-accepting chemotaxis protein
MAKLDAITRQNAALVEQSAAASNAMAEKAKRLSQALSVFKVGTGRV